MRGNEIRCTVDDDVHDICSFVSRLVVLGFVCLFVWGLNDFKKKKKVLGISKGSL